MKHVTCYGTGVIGAAWGVVFLKGGCKVSFYDIDEEKLREAEKSVAATFRFFQENDLMNEEEIRNCLANAVYTTDVAEAVSTADFIQENCPERLELKRKVLALIEAHCPADAIIASSTSGLLITDIAAEATHPERIIGAHPYNPVYMIPLVEITKGDRTEQAYVDAAKAFYTENGKEPVVLNKECLGFLCNRIQVAVLREAWDLVYRGVCTVEDIDKAVVYSLGLRWGVVGPHLVNQLGGGAGGFRGLLSHLGGAVSLWLKDMATWTEIPEGYEEIGQVGVDEEMANRAPGTGQTNAELGTYMNQGLITLLKYHKKL